MKSTRKQARSDLGIDKQPLKGVARYNNRAGNWSMSSRQLFLSDVKRDDAFSPLRLSSLSETKKRLLCLNLQCFVFDIVY